jgi:hypothetical protein
VKTAAAIKTLPNIFRSRLCHSSSAGARRIDMRRNSASDVILPSHSKP